jgi:hypothetical protein
VLRRGRPATVVGRSIDPFGQRKSAIIRWTAPNLRGPSMTIKFEGKPPFCWTGIVLRATISVPEMRPKSVPVPVPRDDRRCLSISGAVADCRENGRASKAARRLEDAPGAQYAKGARLGATPFRHRDPLSNSWSFAMFAFALHRACAFLNDPKLLFRRPAPPRRRSGDQFNPLIVVRHGHVLEDIPKHSLRAMPGVRSNV